MEFGSSHQEHLLYLGILYSHFKTQLGHHHLQEAILDSSCQPTLVAVSPSYAPGLYSNLYTHTREFRNLSVCLLQNRDLV